MSSEWVRALGIDYGTVRIGLAVSDDIGMMAHPLETLERLLPEDAVNRILEIVETRSIEDVVVGWPVQMSGKEGSAVERVETFLGRLLPRLPQGVSVHRIDERLSTRTAREKLEASGRKLKKNRGVLDQAAAMEILQEWLDTRLPNVTGDEVGDTCRT